MSVPGEGLEGQAGTGTGMNGSVSDNETNDHSAEMAAMKLQMEKLEDSLRQQQAFMQWQKQMMPGTWQVPGRPAGQQMLQQPGPHPPLQGGVRQSAAQTLGRDQSSVGFTG